MVRQRGYTIIEVMLFLAVSGLLLAAAMATINVSIRNARFTDSMRSTQSYMQQQYSEVMSGVARRESSVACPGGGTAAPGESNDCILNGRLLDIAGDRVSVYNVVSNGHRATCSSSEASNTESWLVASYCPRVASAASGAGLQAADNFVLPWGVTADKSTYNRAGVVSPFNRVAILRSPVSERMYMYTWQDDAALGVGTVLEDRIVEANRNKQAAICMRYPDLSGDRYYVQFGGGQGADAIRASSYSGPLEGGLTC